MTTGPRFLVDTSAWIETLRPDGDPALRQLVGRLTADDRAVLCDLVRLELWNGARSGRDGRFLREMESQLETVPTTPEVWDFAIELARKAREKGLTFPATDILIAACAKRHGLGLVHRDTHLEQLAKLS